MRDLSTKISVGRSASEEPGSGEKDNKENASPPMWVDFGTLCASS